MQPKTLKYLLDIQSVIQEIESVKKKTNNKNTKMVIILKNQTFLI